MYGTGDGAGAVAGVWGGAGAKSVLQSGRASEASPHLPSKITQIFELEGVIDKRPSPKNTTTQKADIAYLQ